MPCIEIKNKGAVLAPFIWMGQIEPLNFICDEITFFSLEDIAGRKDQ